MIQNKFTHVRKGEGYKKYKCLLHTTFIPTFHSLVLEANIPHCVMLATQLHHSFLAPSEDFDSTISQVPKIIKVRFIPCPNPFYRADC